MWIPWRGLGTDGGSARGGGAGHFKNVLAPKRGEPRRPSRTGQRLGGTDLFALGGRGAGGPVPLLLVLNHALHENVVRRRA